MLCVGDVILYGLDTVRVDTKTSAKVCWAQSVIQNQDLLNIEKEKNNKHILLEASKTHMLRSGPASLCVEFLRVDTHRAFGPDPKRASRPKVQGHLGFPSGIIRYDWNDTEKISMAPAQGWHAQIEKCKQF